MSAWGPRHNSFDGAARARLEAQVRFGYTIPTARKPRLLPSWHDSSRRPPEVPMRRAVAVIVLAALAQPLSAAEPDARKVIDGGLKFLAESAVAWKADRKCSSCHHIPMA